MVTQSGKKQSGVKEDSEDGESKKVTSYIKLTASLLIHG